MDCRGRDEGGSKKGRRVYVPGGGSCSVAAGYVPLKYAPIDRCVSRDVRER